MWLTALILGFAGSMHCLGMCAPLVLTVTKMKPGAVLNRVIYNSGRLLTYGLLGALVASVGMIGPLQKYQNILSIILGATLLIIGLGGFDNNRLPGVMGALQKVTSKVKSMFAQQLARKTRFAIFILGLLNGLLPCGLTLIALVWCLTLKGPLDGLNFMLMFGIGTLPVMFGFTAVLPVLLKKVRWSLKRVTASMLILSGCLLIARVFMIHAPHVDDGGLMEIIICRQTLGYR